MSLSLSVSATIPSSNNNIADKALLPVPVPLPLFQDNEATVFGRGNGSEKDLAARIRAERMLVQRPRRLKDYLAFSRQVKLIYRRYIIFFVDIMSCHVMRTGALGPSLLSAEGVPFYSATLHSLAPSRVSSLAHSHCTYTIQSASIVESITLFFLADEDDDDGPSVRPSFLPSFIFRWFITGRGRPTARRTQDSQAALRAVGPTPTTALGVV